MELSGGEWSGVEWSVAGCSRGGGEVLRWTVGQPKAPLLPDIVKDPATKVSITELHKKAVIWAEEFNKRLHTKIASPALNFGAYFCALTIIKSKSGFLSCACAIHTSSALGVL